VGLARQGKIEPKKGTFDAPFRPELLKGRESRCFEIKKRTEFSNFHST